MNNFTTTDITVARKLLDVLRNFVEQNPEYESACNHMEDYLSVKNLTHVHLHDVTAEMITDFDAFLKPFDVCNMRKRFIKKLDTFFAHMVRNRYITVNPCKDINTLPVLNLDQLEKIAATRPVDVPVDHTRRVFLDNCLKGTTHTLNRRHLKRIAVLSHVTLELNASTAKRTYNFYNPTKSPLLWRNQN